MRSFLMESPFGIIITRANVERGDDIEIIALLLRQIKFSHFRQTPQVMNVWRKLLGSFQDNALSTFSNTRCATKSENA